MLEQIEHRGFNINIHQDEDPPNPRTDYDSFGKMALTHRDYNLGDEEFEECKEGEELICAILTDVLGSEYKADAIREAWNDRFINKAVFILKKICPVFLPIYLLDHSGLWVRAGRFIEDPGGWDTSFIGFCYATKAMIINEYGTTEKDALTKAEKCLRAEIKEYSQYLSGNVYGYTVEPTNRNKSIECDDSCWGFYGNTDYMVSEAKAAINCCIIEYRKEVRQQKAEQIATREFYRTVWAD